MIEEKLVKLGWSTQNIAWHWVEGMSMYTSSGVDIVDRDHLMMCIESDGVFVEAPADDITYVMNGDCIRDIQMRNLKICQRSSGMMVAVISDKGQVNHTTLEKDEMDRLVMSYLAAFRPEVLVFLIKLLAQSTS